MPLNPPSYLRLLKNTSQGFQHFFTFYNTKHLRFSVFHAAIEGVLEKRKKEVGKMECWFVMNLAQRLFLKKACPWFEPSFSFFF